MDSEYRSDYVRDSKLQATIDGKDTRHIYLTSSRNTRRRRQTREETWRWEREIGSGTFGKVWLETCVQGDSSGQVRAVKEVKKNIEGMSVDYTRELEAAAKFSRGKYFDCFVKSFGWYETDTTIRIAMENMSKGDLRQHMNRPFEDAEVQKIAWQLAEALEFMHEAGFTHRDLKPANILVKEEGPDWWVKIGDFGICKRAEGTSTSLRTVLGTPGYIAPEVLGLFDDPTESTDSFSYTNAVDMFALGEVIFRLRTQVPAFPSAADLVRYAMHQKMLWVQPLRDHGASEGCYDFIMQAMTAHPRERMTAAEATEHPWVKPSASSGASTPRPASPRLSEGASKIGHFTMDQVRLAELKMAHLVRRPPPPPPVINKQDVMVSLDPGTKPAAPLALPRKPLPPARDFDAEASGNWSTATNLRADVRIARDFAQDKEDSMPPARDFDAEASGNWSTATDLRANVRIARDFAPEEDSSLPETYSDVEGGGNWSTATDLRAGVRIARGFAQEKKDPMPPATDSDDNYFVDIRTTADIQAADRMVRDLAKEQVYYAPPVPPDFDNPLRRTRRTTPNPQAGARMARGSAQEENSMSDIPAPLRIGGVTNAAARHSKEQASPALHGKSAAASQIRLAPAELEQKWKSFKSVVHRAKAGEDLGEVLAESKQQQAWRDALEEIATWDRPSPPVSLGSTLVRKPEIVEAGPAAAEDNPGSSLTVYQIPGLGPNSAPRPEPWNVPNNDTTKDATNVSHDDDEFGMEFQESIRALDAPDLAKAMIESNYDIDHIIATRDRSERFQKVQLAKMFADGGPQWGEPGGVDADEDRIEGPGPYSWTRYTHLHDVAWRERMYGPHRRWSIEALNPPPDEPPNFVLRGILSKVGGASDDADMVERGLTGTIESILRRTGILKR